MSKIEVDAIDKQSGSTLTLGGSGTAVTLASGATQTGFGRTGTVDWQTGSIKTSTFTGVNGEGYFVNTTGGAVTVNLPAGVAGAIVGLKDYAGTWDSNNVTLNPNGSDKIGGGSAEDPKLSVKGGATLLVFVDSTQGWLTTQESVTESPTGTQSFVVATGGTITTSGDCKIHTFTAPGTFAVTGVSNTSANNAVAYMVVAGGAGGGGASRGGGGGAGGFREGRNNPITPYTASPLVTTGSTVTAQSYPITVGAGGANGTNAADGGQGSASIFSSITSAGGGQGRGNPGVAGGNGGSGGGGAGEGGPAAGGTGNTPPVSPAQGTNGGAARVAPNQAGGGGGGATVAGQDGQNPYTGGAGGAGATSSINGTPTARAGGGGGGGNGSPPFRGGAAGAGGGGTGGGQPSPGNNSGTAGTANTGGGGGGAANPTCNPSGLGSAGGSGIVIIRYKYQ